jgi:hypothetical protein
MGLLFCFYASMSYGSDVVGRYSAVTESELVIEFIVKKNSTIKMTVEILAVEEDEETWSKEYSGNWKLKGNKFIIKLKSGEEIVYEILKCLPYSEFGMNGCSFGLKPQKSKSNELDFLLKYGLWKDDDLKKLNFLTR